MHKLVIFCTALSAFMCSGEEQAIETMGDNSGANGKGDDSEAVPLPVYPDVYGNRNRNLEGPDGEEIPATPVPTPASTLPPRVRHCQGECGDHYYTCAMVDCEGVNFNETDSENNMTEAFDSGKNETEIDVCWVHCRAMFTECFDNCKVMCLNSKNCASVHQELILPPPPVEGSYRWKTEATLSSSLDNM